MHVLVMGGGPAGATAALKAVELGAEVTLVERRRVGGTTLNDGPAPVRTLARAARLVRDWNSWPTFGLHGPRPEVDLSATLANAERVARYAHDRKHISDHIRAMGVDLIEEAGDTRFVDANTVAAPDGRVWKADRVIIAVGGRAARLPVPGAELALTFEDVRSLRALPDRVCVIGAADTGCQLTSILADFGCRVSLLEWSPRILPRADEHVSAELERAFRARGIDVITSAGVERLEPRKPGGVRVFYKTGDATKNVEADAAFFAVGWPGNADRIDSAAAGVATRRGYAVVDDYLCTSVPHIFAAGDVDGHSMLVSSALLDGRVAAENAVLGPRRRIVHEIVPAGSFTDPEYASVGLTEEQARARYDCAVAVARYDDLLRPVADGQPDGFCKLIIETERRQIVGAHVLGEYSAEVIQMVATCMTAGMRIEDVAELQIAFPTFTEGVSMAAKMLVRELGIRPMPLLWSSLSAPASASPRRGEPPDLPKIERLDSALDRLIAADARVEILAQGYDWSEGPVWVPVSVKDGGFLLFSDVPQNVIHRWKEGEGASEWLRPSGYTGHEPRSGELGSNGLLIDREGRLVVCQHGDRRIARMEAPLSAPAPHFSTLADRCAGARFNSPNDVTLDRNGDLYFTDPPYGLPAQFEDAARELPYQGVFRRQRDGRVSLLTRDMTRPNGLALSPDGRTLYVSQSDPAAPIWRAFDVLADGTLGASRVLFDASTLMKTQRGLPDGLKLDTEGNLFATGPGGVLILTPEGKHLGTILTGQATGNCAFGDDGYALYITADMYLMRVRLKARGLGF